MVDIEQAWTEKGYKVFYTETSEADGGIALLEYGEIPYFLRGNPYITSGYRAYLSYRKCIFSLFILSNETINIWTHLAGFLIFLALSFHANFIIIPSGQGSLGDHIVFTCYLAFYKCCMAASAGYHMFCCHSEKLFHCWLALDLAGISLALCGCYLPGVYFGFYCQPTLQAIYLAIVVVLSLMSLLLQCHPKYFTSVWASKRLASFGFIALFGFCPIVHWTYIYGGFSQTIVQIFLPKVVTMYILGFMALTVYAVKFPENCFPGKLNYIGASHQWWHVLIVVAFCWWYISSVQFFFFRQKYGCLIDDQTLEKHDPMVLTNNAIAFTSHY